MFDSSTFVFYNYTPSLISAAIFVVLFTLGAIAHLYHVIRLRAYYFVPFTIGCIFEAIGYVGRALSHSNPQDLTFYIIQSLLILVAPALYAATIYMTLGRIIRILDAEQNSLIRLKWLTKVFVIGDVLSFFIQSGGAGIQAQGKVSSADLGSNIVIGGLIFQMGVFGFFVVVAIVFNLRTSKRPTINSNTLGWRRHMAVLYFTSAVILVRNAIRVVEYVEGRTGFISSHEYMLYIFDAVFMFIVTFVFLAYHPSRLLSAQKLHVVQSLDSEAGLGCELVGVRVEKR